MDYDYIALAIAVGLVFLNGFFVATEFAIVKVRPTKIKEMVRAGSVGARGVPGLLRHLDGYLSATQLGITLASLGLGWLGEPAFARLLEGPMQSLGFADPDLAHKIALPLAFLIITYLHIVVGELAPKSMAIMRAESVAIAVAYPMRAIYFLFFPFTWLLNSQARLILRLFGMKTAGEGGETHHSEEEIRIILSQARSAGLLSGERADILQKALSLPTKTVRHLMVPRSEVVYLDVTLTLDENLARAEASEHTRFPLCRGGLDEVIGILDVRKLLFALHKEAVDLTELAQRAGYFPETMSGERLLTEFRRGSMQMAIIVDEYGGTSGIVTAADVVSTVMGELEDDEEAEWVELPGGMYDVEGTTALEELEDELHITFPSHNMRTVAGFLMERLGRMPQVHDRVVVNGYSFNVREVVGPKVTRVRIQRDVPRPAARGKDGRNRPGGRPPTSEHRIEDAGPQPDPTRPAMGR